MNFSWRVLGSGILSYMAAQAGASQVIAVEASGIADKISQLQSISLAAGINPHLSNIAIVRDKIETESAQAKIQAILESTSEPLGKSHCVVDTIVSEPIGFMLFHERMIESFILARDRYLKPGGTILPSQASLWFVPIEDGALWNETDSKKDFFHQRIFGTDFSPLVESARMEAFSQPVVGPISPSTIRGEPKNPKHFDFYTITEKELQSFKMEMEWETEKVGIIHGLGCWFDLDFYPAQRTTDGPLLSPLQEEHDEQLRQAWENLPVPSSMAQQELANQYYVGNANPAHSETNLLDPQDLPEAPIDGWQVRLDTGPYSPRTHWQQGRLLLPEPLATNRGQTVHAEITFTAHEARSYYIDIDLWIVPDGPHQIKDAVIDDRTRRKARWNLAQQVMNYWEEGSSPQVKYP